MNRCLPFFIFFLFAIQLCVAQEQISAKPPIQFQHLTEGLNNERITTIYQDLQGFIWIGTYNGLHRYDGIKFKIYLNTSDSTSIPNNRIERIFNDSKGNLWVGTANSICRYNRDFDNFKRFPVKSGLVDASDPEPNRISAIVETKEGKIWIASEKEGLFYFDGDQQEFIPYFNKKTGLALSSIHVKELSLGKSDEIWIGLNGGLNKLNTQSGQVTQFPFDPDQPNNIAGNNVRGMAMDVNGDLWIGTRSNGLYVLKEKNQESKIFDHFTYDPENENSLGNNSVYTIFFDHKNQLWIGNENGGLHLYNRSNHSFFRYLPEAKDPFSISNNSIWSIFEDRDRRLWIGTGLKGVNLVDNHFVKFKHYYSSPLNSNGLNNNLVRGFWEDKKGNVWIATDGGGLNYWDRKRNVFSHYTHDPQDAFSIGSDALLDFTEDKEGRLWISTWAGGVNVLIDRQKMQFKKAQELQSKDSVAAEVVSSFALLTDSEGVVWSGNYDKGLSIYDLKNNNTRLFVNDPNDKNSLSSNTLYSVFEDSKGNIWAGGENNGLNKVIKGENGKVSFKAYKHDANDSTSISGNIVNQIIEDSKNQIWVGTSGGLSKYVKESDRFVNYSSKDGLPSDFVVSIVEDKNGFFWVGTEKGLSKFDPSSGTFRNYTKNDGLQGDKFSRHAVTALSTGEVMFGGTNGFNIFFPHEVIDNPNKPEVYLTDLKLFNKSVTVGEFDSLLRKDISLSKQISLKHRQNVVTFEFTALNYTHSSKNQYAYMLEGLEEEWNYVGNMQVATYTNLDPGDYTFKVKASNNDGIWNEEGAQIQIVVLPPWYRTWWFYILALISIIALFYGFIKLREKQLKEDKAVLANAIEAKTVELKKKEEEILARDESDKIRNWTALGLNDFSVIVNKNKDDIQKLSQNILSRLIKFLDVNQGALTLLNDENENDPYLEVVATYAHDEGHKGNRRIELSQGLLGVCYSSGEIRYIDNLPEEYSKVSSGLGESKIKYLLLVPLRLDEFIIGVIELSSFKPIKDHEIDFLKKLGEIITSSLYTLKVSHKTSLLLEQARAQAEELQAQEEEIRQNMEEMEATQEDFTRKERELTEKLKQTEEENAQLKSQLKKKLKG